MGILLGVVPMQHGVHVLELVFVLLESYLMT